MKCSPFSGIAKSIRALRPTSLGVFLAVFSAVIWGTHAPAERGVYSLGGNVALVLVVTTWARALALLAASAVTKQKLFPSIEDAKQAFIGGAFQALTVFCIFWALLTLQAPVAIIIVYTHSLMLLFFLAWRGEIKLNTTTVLTTIAALGGLSLVVDIWHRQASANWIGICLSFVAALATASRYYVYGHQTKTRHPAAVGAENFLFAAPLASVILFFSPLQFPAASAGFFWLGVASAALALGTVCMFYGISLIGPFRFSLFSKLEPVFTSLFSVWFLGEILKPRQYLGILVVIGSLALYQMLEQRRKRKQNLVDI